MERPNILFIMADQMSAKALSVYGHKDDQDAGDRPAGR